MSRKPDPFATLQDLIRRLERANIAFTLGSHREEGISITAAVPGERWEIDVLDDGTVDFERFVSTGEMQDRDDILGQIARHSDSPVGATE